MTEQQSSHLSTENQARHQTPTRVSVRTIIIAAISFIAGILATLFLQKMIQTTPESFSASDLITFVFSIALSAAAIILAIAAISLGKASENSMIQRSDESIHLQNEIFTRTTDALQRIESSTGVTEKRIEDIVSGRAGAISGKIVDTLLEDRGSRPKSRKTLEKEIRESIIQELKPPSRIPEYVVKEMEEERIKREEARTRYNQFNDNLLLAATNLSDVKTLKMGAGDFNSSGFGLVDGVVQRGIQIVGICTFSNDELLREMFGADTTFGMFLQSLAPEIIKNTFSDVILAFDQDLDSQSPFQKAIESIKAVVKPEIASKLHVIAGSYQNIAPALEEIFGTQSKVT